MRTQAVDHRETVRPLAQMQVDADLDLLALQMRRDRRFVIARDRKAPFGDLRRAEADRQLVALGWFAGLPDRHDDAAPIRILAGDGGLHQR